MAGANDFSKNFLRALKDLMPEEQAEVLRQKAEKVAQEGLDGLEQLKEDVNKVVANAKKTTDDALKSLEDAFSEFQTNVQQHIDERRRAQIDELHGKLAQVEKRLGESNVSQQERTKLESKIQEIIEAIKNSGEQLTKEIIDQFDDLSKSITDAAEKGSKDLKAAIAEAVKAAQEMINTELNK